jgi:hypothetical protein
MFALEVLIERPGPGRRACLFFDCADRRRLVAALGEEFIAASGPPDLS